MLTVATSLPVDGRSPGSGCVVGVVRGAASRCVLSCVGGGVAREIVLAGGRLAAGIGAGFSSAGRSNASGALRDSASAAGAAIKCTRYVGGRRRCPLGAAKRNMPTTLCTTNVPVSAIPIGVGVRARVLID